MRLEDACGEREVRVKRGECRERDGECCRGAWREGGGMDTGRAWLVSLRAAPRVKDPPHLKTRHHPVPRECCISARSKDGPLPPWTHCARNVVIRMSVVFILCLQTFSFSFFICSSMKFFCPPSSSSTSGLQLNFKTRMISTKFYPSNADKFVPSELNMPQSCISLLVSLTKHGNWLAQGTVDHEV